MTPFSDIFQRFFNKVTDSDLALLPQENLDSIMQQFLQSAIVRFQKCKKDVNNIDTVNQTFNVLLNSVEIEILANWMKYEWIDQQTNRIELLKQSLSSKDYAMYSQANHLDKLLTLKQQVYLENNQMIIDYSYSEGLSELR